MWLFLPTGFISVVQKPDDKGTLTVRARVKGQIESIFHDAIVTQKAGTDYAYRAKVLREEVATVIADQIMTLEYDNFKNAIRDNDYHDACSGVWSVMYRYQASKAPKPRNQRQLNGMF